MLCVCVRPAGWPVHIITWIMIMRDWATNGGFALILRFVELLNDYDNLLTGTFQITIVGACVLSFQSVARTMNTNMKEIQANIKQNDVSINGLELELWTMPI